MAKEKRYISEEERLAARSKKKSKKSWSSRKTSGKSAKSERPEKSSAARKPRRPKRESKFTPQQRIAILFVILIVAILFFGRVKKIVSLNIENRRLRAQQEQLEEERDRLESKLKNVDNSDYIEEQARKQLRLMNPDEILFIFDEEDKSGKK